MTEQDMVEAVVGRLRRNGISAAVGVPFMWRCIDLLLVGEDCIEAIEFKLRDWRRGIRQAQDHLLGADYAYICIPSREPTAQLAQACAESGIGLLLFDAGSHEPFEVAIPATRSDRVWQPGRTWLVETAAAHTI